MAEPLSAGATQVTVAAAATTTHLRSSTDATTYGAEVTFTATAPDGVAGSVQFEDGDTDLGEPVEVSGGTATYATSELDAGEHHITAVFTPADRSYAASTSAVTTVTVAAASTTAELAVSASAPTAGDTVSFTAAVTDGVAGHVRFRDGDTPLGEAVAVEDGTATYSTNELPVGDHSITAVFTPSSSNYAGSTSDVVQVSVAPAPTGSGDDAPPPGDTAMPAPTPGPAPAPGPVPGVAPAPKKPKLLGAVVAGHKVHAVLPVVAGAPAGARTKIVWYVDGKKVGKGHKLKLKARWRGLKLTCTVTTTWGKGHHKHTVIKKSKAKRIKG